MFVIIGETLVYGVVRPRPLLTPTGFRGQNTLNGNNNSCKTKLDIVVFFEKKLGMKLTDELGAF